MLVALQMITSSGFGRNPPGGVGGRVVVVAEGHPGFVLFAPSQRGESALMVVEAKIIIRMIDKSANSQPARPTRVCRWVLLAISRIS